jgi:hypothetical protein
MPSRFQLPPIIKAAERLLVDIENAVRRFPRYHRYQVGADLRRRAMDAYRTAWRAWQDRKAQAHWVEQLVWIVDEIKQHLQIGKQLHAFVSFAQFEMLFRQAQGLGKQAGGWRRDLSHPIVQNADGRRAVSQRDEKLSAHAASMLGANP